MKLNQPQYKHPRALPLQYTLLMAVFFLHMTSCRLYDREYYERIPIPEVNTDTIHIDPWIPVQDSVLMLPQPTQKTPQNR